MYLIGRGPTRDQVLAAIDAIPLIGGYDLDETSDVKDLPEAAEFAFDLDTYFDDDEDKITTSLSQQLGVRVISLAQWQREVIAAHPEYATSRR